MDRFDIQKLRDLPIEAVARRLGLEVSRHRALCPFHPDSHPSLTFSVSRNAYKCFVCGAGGGVIDLCMQVLGKSFRESCEWLAGENSIILERWQPPVKQIRRYPPDTDYLAELVRVPSLNEAARCFLFDCRRYRPEVVKWLGISSISRPTPCWRYGRPFYDAPSLLFPYRDVDGRVLNVQSRYLGDPVVGKVPVPRFRFPSNSSIHIFNLPILRHLGADEPLFVSEGITDCIALLSAGHKAIAIPSATLLKADDLAPLCGRWRGALHIFPDNDDAGARLYRQLLEVTVRMGRCLVKHPLPPDCKDFSEYWLKGGGGGS